MPTDEERMGRYRQEEWDHDLHEWFSRGTPTSRDIPGIVAYVEERYPGDPNRGENCERLWAALAFLEANLPGLVQAGVARRGAEGTELPMGLKTALYRAFLSFPVGSLGRCVDMPLVVRLTKEQKDWNEDRT